MPAHFPKLSARIAFSYERVSSKEQAKEGRVGLERQADEFLPFCERHGLTPNPDPIKDEGLSAFHGKHWKSGNLGGFITAAEQGLIPEGSVLVVEDWSRFSRRKISDSQLMLHRLFELGLGLGWVRKDVVITKKSFDDSFELRLNLDVSQQQAHGFSAGNSKTTSQVWAIREKKYVESGQKYLSMSSAPDWLAIRDGDFVETDRANLMREVFQLRSQGFGASQIARKLTTNGHRLSGGGSFTEGRVGRILRDRRLLGEKKWSSGLVSPGYFPKVIDDSLWQKVQKLVDEANANPGRTGKGDPIRNILQGVTFCSCGAPVSWQGTHKNKDTGEFRYSYLRCTAKRQSCPTKSSDWKYDEQLLLVAFMDHRWQQFFKTPVNNKKIRDLRKQVRDQEATCSELEDKAQNSKRHLDEAMGASDFDKSLIQMLGKSVKDLANTADSAQKGLSRLKSELQILEMEPSASEMAKQIRERTESFLTSLDDLEERKRFNNWVNTLGVRLTIIDGKTGEMSWDKIQANLYREGDTLVIDQTKQDAAVLGLPEALLVSGKLG
ncbi:recombinase family protein [Synechococcus sp. AH-551-G15]|nr:recombinase family protein [Synechococcus sp. AH-551-G15]